MLRTTSPAARKCKEVLFTGAINQIKEAKEKLKRILEKQKLQEKEIEEIINQLDGEEPIQAEPDEKPIKQNYRTSCVSLERKGKLLTEF